MLLQVQRRALTLRNVAGLYMKLRYCCLETQGAEILTSMNQYDHLYRFGGYIVAPADTSHFS